MSCIQAVMDVRGLCFARNWPHLASLVTDESDPKGMHDYVYTNKVISDFIESFKEKILQNRNKARERNQYAHGCKVRYVWAREVGWGQRPHYHLLILLNRDAYYTVGRMRTTRRNLITRLQEAWASALGLSVDRVEGLVEIPDNATYRIDRYVRDDRKDELPALFHRASYLCKAATKSYRDHQRGFDTSKG